MGALRDDELALHGEMRPPWAVFPYHPFSMGWRMGPGEAYKRAFWAWWRDASPAMSEPERISYLERWPGRAGWTHVMIGMVWGVDGVDLILGEEEALADWFRRGETIGLPSLAEYEADMDADDWDA